MILCVYFLKLYNQNLINKMMIWKKLDVGTTIDVQWPKPNMLVLHIFSKSIVGSKKGFYEHCKIYHAHSKVF